MKNTYTAVVKQDGDWWIGWVKEIPGVNCQEATREELLQTLRVTVSEALEFRRDERRLVQAATKLSEDAFKQVWDNEEDSVYDQL